MKMFSIFFLLFFISPLYSQSLKPQREKLNFGIMEESTLLFTKDAFKKDGTNTGIYPVSLYLSGRYNLDNHFSLEIRPGFLFGNKYYQGMELGFFVRYIFSNKKFNLIAGINFHKNSPYEYHYYYYNETNDGVFTLLNLSTSYFLRDNFALIVSLYYPIKPYELAKNHSDPIDEYRLDPSSISIRHIIKIGLDYTF